MEQFPPIKTVGSVTFGKLPAEQMTIDVKPSLSSLSKISELWAQSWTSKLVLDPIKRKSKFSFFGSS